MELTIKGEAKEIAALVVEIQEQLLDKQEKLTVSQLAKLFKPCLDVEERRVGEEHLKC